MMANKPLALVTGGASGMGLATVERLARDGFRLALIDRDRALADKETARLHPLVQALPPITALVNNAGAFDERPFLEVSSADFRRAYEINLIAVATLTQ